MISEQSAAAYLDIVRRDSKKHERENVIKKKPRSYGRRTNLI